MEFFLTLVVGAGAGDIPESVHFEVEEGCKETNEDTVSGLSSQIVAKYVSTRKKKKIHLRYKSRADQTWALNTELNK